MTVRESESDMAGFEATMRLRTDGVKRLLQSGEGSRWGSVGRGDPEGRIASERRREEVPQRVVVRALSLPTAFLWEVKGDSAREGGIAFRAPSPDEMPILIHVEAEGDGGRVVVKRPHSRGREVLNLVDLDDAPEFLVDEVRCRWIPGPLGPEHRDVAAQVAVNVRESVEQKTICMCESRIEVSAA
jgi:hypothetical protein